MGELADQPDETFTHEYVSFPLVPLVCSAGLLPYLRERREHRIFRVLLDMVPGLEDRLMEGSEDNVVAIAGLVWFLGYNLIFELKLCTDSKGDLQREI
jgi:hypothetical protein